MLKFWKKVNFCVKTFSKKWIIIFIFCENYESYYFVITLVFVKMTVFKKKKKVSILYWDSEKKSLLFHFFSQFFSKKMNYDFQFLLELWNLFFAPLLLCLWKRLCLKRKKRVDSILRFWKKSLLLHFFFEFFFEKMNRHFHNFSMDFHNHNLTI